MPFTIEERPSDSPLVQAVWRTVTGDVTSFVSVASTHCQLVLTRRHGISTLTLRGPETKPSLVECPDEAEFIGLELSLGVFVPPLSDRRLLDKSLVLAETTSSKFDFKTLSVDVPRVDDYDAFADRLMVHGLFQRDDLAFAVSEGRPPRISTRSLQRRFLHATGLTQAEFRQIEQARRATWLLSTGTSILDTVAEAGYADQPHLTRALRRWTGQTPAQLLNGP